MGRQQQVAVYGLAVAHEAWVKDAACRGTDVNMFFDQSREALNYCHRCPVATECADFAFNNRILEGIWGGVTCEQRAAGVRYMPGEESLAPAAKRVLALHRSGVRWAAITRTTGVSPQTIFRIVQGRPHRLRDRP